MSDSDDYKRRLNPLNKLTIVSGPKSQVKDAQGNVKRKYTRTNVKIQNNPSAKMEDTFGTPLSIDKIKSGDFTSQMNWNIYKSDVEPKLMTRMTDEDDENMKQIVEAALMDDNIHHAEIITMDQATMDRARNKSMYEAHKKAIEVDKRAAQGHERIIREQNLPKKLVKLENDYELALGHLNPGDTDFEAKQLALTNALTLAKAKTIKKLQDFIKKQETDNIKYDDKQKKHLATMQKDQEDKKANKEKKAEEKAKKAEKKMEKQKLDREVNRKANRQKAAANIADQKSRKYS